MDEELTQHDGIAIAATTGNWNSRRRNGHIIGACWQSAAVSRLQAPLMQAVRLRRTGHLGACPANGDDHGYRCKNGAETFLTPCDLAWFTTIAEAVYGLVMVSIPRRLPT
jgi:hypothetical protein